MPVDPVLVLIYVGSGVGSLFLVLSMTAVATSVRKRRADRRRRATRDRVRNSLFSRAAQDDPDWDAWIATLSKTEKTELADVIEQYLRTLRGSERETFLAVASALGMGKKANERLDHPSVITRLQALARLSVLDYPIDEKRLLDTCLGNHRTRESAARLLYERRDEFAKADALGTVLLIWGGQEPMGIRGLETLYDFNNHDPDTLFSQGFWGLQHWQDTVIVQVCTVLQACRIRRIEPAHDWVFSLLDHSKPQLRAAAIRAVRNAGYRDDVRDRIPFTQLVTDTSPAVRRSTYQVLANWGDSRSYGLLEWAVIDEQDERAQLLAIHALASLEGEPNADQPGWPDAAWAWVRAERAIQGDQPLTIPGVKT